jgi:uncharacterized DUF497 family protein
LRSFFIPFWEYPGGWTFEFDRAKSETNKAKHGIDFTQAQRLWADSDHDRWRRRSMRAQDLDRKFHAGEEDIISDLDVRAARRPGRDVQRVNVDFPIWMVESLDAEATRLGITRQAIIKTWIAERLDRRVS